MLCWNQEAGATSATTPASQCLRSWRMDARAALWENLTLSQLCLPAKMTKKGADLPSTSHAELISLVEDSLRLELWVPRCMENMVPHFPTSSPEGGWNEGRVSPSTHGSQVLTIPFQGLCCGLHASLAHSSPGGQVLILLMRQQSLWSCRVLGHRVGAKMGVTRFYLILEPILLTTIILVVTVSCMPNPACGRAD